MSELIRFFVRDDVARIAGIAICCFWPLAGIIWSEISNRK